MHFVECVQHIIETLILPTLRSENIGISSVIHAGSQYEYSALPGNSDFDLQFCINLAHCHPKPEAIRCDWEGWVRIEGGPSSLLDDDGNLASSKVGAHIYYITAISCCLSHTKGRHLW